MKGRSTQALVGRYLAKMAKIHNWTASTLKGYRSVMNHLVEACPRLPATKEAVLKAIGDTSDTAFSVMVRRYDNFNRFFKHEIVEALGIPNPCDEIPRPRESDLIITSKLVDQYLEMRRVSVGSEDTFKNDERVLARLVLYCRTLPASFSQIGKVLGNPKEYSGATRRLHYTVLHGFFSWKGVKDLGLDNLLDQIKKPKAGKSRRRVFTTAEMMKLVDAALTPMDQALILFLLDTGVRIGEVVGMQLSDIGAGHVWVTGKSDRHSVRTSPEMEQILRDQANESGDIWWDENGPLSLGQIRYRYDRTVKAAGLTGKKLGPHTIRHSFATTWLRQKGGEFQLQKQLGHADLSTTQKYEHLIDEDVAEAQKLAAPTAVLGLFGASDSTGCTNEDETAIPDGIGPDGPPLVVTRANIAAMVAAEVRRTRAAEEQRQREERTQVSVERLVQEECTEREGGRPSITLPAPVARMILDDHEAGYSISAIWRKYSPYYKFSRAWLTNALADGRLKLMAESNSETP